jgi:hypothetical protein
MPPIAPHAGNEGVNLQRRLMATPEDTSDGSSRPANPARQPRVFRAMGKDGRWLMRGARAT